MILSGSTEFGGRVGQTIVERFGITGTFMSPWLQLIVNTPNTSIIGLRCVGVVYDNMGETARKSEAKINLTIYGKYLISVLTDNTICLFLK